MEEGLFALGGVLLGSLLSYFIQQQHYELSERRRLGMELTRILRDRDQFDRRVHDVMFVFPPTSRTYELYAELTAYGSSLGAEWSDAQRHRIVREIAKASMRRALPPTPASAPSVQGPPSTAVGPG